MGGHVAGGAFGFFCREFGLAADYLYAVEVITVDADGNACTLLATCESNDPNRELWWAHTGAGGGNFGIVTRYLFRMRDAASDNPTELLPKAPERITTFEMQWDWRGMDASTFQRLLTNHGMWSEQNSAPDSPNITFWSLLEIRRQQAGQILIRGLSTSLTGAEKQISDYAATMNTALASTAEPVIQQQSWLEFTLNPFPELFGGPPDGASLKVKDAMLKKRLTDDQIAVVYEYMTSSKYDVMGGMFGFAAYGGRVNARSTDATAAPQRNSIFDVACNVGWIDPNDTETNLAWVRDFYRDLFADTGGVPVPGERYDGSLINHPDVDHADASFNKSGIPWHTIYFQRNYERLQLAKIRWDSKNIFRHALSIRPPGH